jgi:tetratricopeptide (TPR) repeat protein
MRRKKGGDAAKVAKAECFIADIFQWQGRYEDAVRGYLEALQICCLVDIQGTSGDVGFTGFILNQLCVTYTEQGKYEEAHKTGQDALLIARRIEENGHLVAGVICSLGNIFLCQEMWNEAAEKYEDSLRKFRAINCNEDEHVAIALSNLATCYTCLGRPEEALEMYKKALSMLRSTVLGEGQNNEAQIICAIAGLYIQMYADGGKHDDHWQLDKALDLLHEALQISRRIHGEKHSMTALILCKTGNVYRLQGKLDLSLKVHKKALKYRRRFLDGGNRSVADSIVAIGCVHMLQEKFADALVMMEEAQGIYSVALCKESESFGDNCMLMADCKERMSDREGALASAREAHRVHSKLGSSHAAKAQAAAAMVQRLILGA